LRGLVGDGLPLRLIVAGNRRRGRGRGGMGDAGIQCGIQGIELRAITGGRRKLHAFGFGHAPFGLDRELAVRLDEYEQALDLVGALPVVARLIEDGFDPLNDRLVDDRRLGGRMLRLQKIVAQRAHEMME
jgi:hypothetical protein